MRLVQTVSLETIQANAIPQYAMPQYAMPQYAVNFALLPFAHCLYFHNQCTLSCTVGETVAQIFLWLDTFL